MNENINNCPSAYFKWTVMVEFKNPLGIFNLDDFSYLYEDIELKRIAEKASYYFILQRPCLIFRNLKRTLRQFGYAKTGNRNRIKTS